MKRIVAFVFILSVFFTAFVMRSFAEDASEYKIEQTDGGYRFIKNGVVLSESDNLDSLIDGLCALKEPIYFDRVNYGGELTVDGDAVFCGSLNAKGIYVNYGARLKLQNAEIRLDEGITVYGGECTLDGGSIISKNCAVKLNTFSTSQFTMLGGVLQSEGGQAAIISECGRTVLTGGEIVNEYGPAIINKADLHIGNVKMCAIGYEIITENAIWLYSEDEGFDGAIRIKLNKLFEKGTKETVVYNAYAELADRLTVYDKNGMAEAAVFQDGVICVYKPFEAKFIFKDKTQKTVYFLKNTAVNSPTPSALKGYEFLGWSLGIESDLLYDFASVYNGDIILYEVQRLKPPTYSINGIDAVYDCEEHILSFSEIKHELNGSISYTWFSEQGETVSTNSFLSFKHVSDSGRYKCKLSFTFGSDTVMVETPYIDVVISPKIIPVPTVEGQIYNGKALYPNIDGNGFSYENVGFVNAGVYLIELTLSDPNNTRWQSNDAERVSVKFEILKAENKITQELEVFDTYIGAEILWVAKALFGEAQIMFSDKLNGEYFSTPPSAVGTYYAIVKVEGTGNYGSVISPAVSFSILEDRIKCFSVNTYPTKSVYNAFELFDPSGLTFDVLYESGRLEAIDSSNVRFRYLSGDCFSVLHGSLYAEYCGQALLLPVTVKPAEYDITLTLNDEAKVFNALYQTLTPVGEIFEGRDGSLPTYTVTGGGTDVGQYTVTLEFQTDSIEYNAPKPIVACLQILPLSVNAIWSDLFFVYDGSVKCPKAYYKDAYGVTVQLEVTGGAAFAGESYTAYAICDNVNYSLINANATFSIEKAKYDLSSIYWTQSQSVYNGKPITVSINGLPEGVSVVGYINNSAINAGDYCATAVLSGDLNNYYPIENPTYCYSILKADYSLDGFSVLGNSVIFDGMLHYPSVNGEPPVGFDGIALEYSFSHGVINTFDNAKITVSFSSKSVNYNIPDSFTVNVFVKPMGVYVEWTNTAFTYNGTEQKPSAVSEYCNIKVICDSVNAGSYTATAITEDENYTILNPSCDFVIKKVENRWTTAPQVFDIFFGREINYIAECAFGKVICDVYEDYGLSKIAQLPLATGKYYAVLHADAGENYYSLTSTPLSFNVIPILPSAIIAEGKRDYVAFDRVSPTDLTVTLVNNDGSMRTLSFNEIILEYQSGDALRAGDNNVRIAYGTVIYDYRVTVARADYDFSNLVWMDTVKVYDGREHTPKLIGLPSGVEVIEYIGGDAVNAGEYEIIAVLSYDTDNYNQPKNPTTVLKVEKCGITPVAISSIYNGMRQSPIAENGLYYFEAAEYVDSGTYYVTAYLTDEENYYLTESVAEYVIKPRSMTVKVNDSASYWFEDASDFSVSLGQGFNGSVDDLGLEYYVENGEIYVKASNKNYELAVTPGRVIKHNRFSPKVTRSMYISLLLYLLLILAAVIIVVRREDIYALSKKLFKRKVIISTAGGVEYPPLDFVSIDVERADALLTDGIAKTLIMREDCIKTDGRKKCVINVDTLSENFVSGERVDINVLKERGLIPTDAGYLKVLGRGAIDKNLRVFANAFSLSAVKMIVLTGGSAIITKKGK